MLKVSARFFHPDFHWRSIASDHGVGTGQHYLVAKDCGGRSPRNQWRYSGVSRPDYRTKPLTVVRRSGSPGYGPLDA